MHRILVCPSVQHASILPSVQLNNAQVTYQPTDFSSIRMSVRLSIRPERFPCICPGTHGWTGRELGMLIYPDHHQNWLGCGHVDFPTCGTTLTCQNWIVRFEFSEYLLKNAWIDGPKCGMMMTWPSKELTRFWSGPANFRCVGATFYWWKWSNLWFLVIFVGMYRRMAWNLICWCILPTFILTRFWSGPACCSRFGAIFTYLNWSNLSFSNIFLRTRGRNILQFGMLMYPEHFRTDWSLVRVCWFSSFWCHFDLVNMVGFDV